MGFPCTGQARQLQTGVSPPHCGVDYWRILSRRCGGLPGLSPGRSALVPRRQPEHQRTVSATGAPPISGASDASFQRLPGRLIIMDAMAERWQRIEDALRRCAADLDGAPLHVDSYEAWRLDLGRPFSVPTALGIAGTKAEFAQACLDLGVSAISRKSRQQRTEVDESIAPPVLPQVWEQSTVSAALRLCAQNIDGTPSERSYEAWRLAQEVPDSLPPVRVISDLAWGWQLSLASLRVTSRRRSDIEIWAHVRLVRDELGDRVTRGEYERFRIANSEMKLVSASTLRVRTERKWSELFGRDGVDSVRLGHT